jgi:phosphopantothenoylcysteine synthetase/decarboxylase
VRVLITAGGTEEPIDGVRRLTNTSTGATGGVIARGFAERGAEVVLLHGARAPLETTPVERATFTSFDDLEHQLQHLLGGRDFDAVVHLAAVSDYRVAAVEVDGRAVPHGDTGKIPSGREVVLRLAATPKLIDRLRDWSRNPAIRVIGFKLTNDPEPDERRRQVRALLDRGVADLVVHNDLGGITEGRHPAEIWDRSRRLAGTTTKEELANALFGLLAGAGTHAATAGLQPEGPQR